MSPAVDHRIVEEIRLIRAKREERFRRDMEEIDRQYDREIGNVHLADQLGVIAALLYVAAVGAVLAIFFAG